MSVSSSKGPARRRVPKEGEPQFMGAPDSQHKDDPAGEPPKKEDKLRAMLKGDGVDEATKKIRDFLDRAARKCADEASTWMEHFNLESEADRRAWEGLISKLRACIESCMAPKEETASAGEEEYGEPLEEEVTAESGGEESASELERVEAADGATT